MAPGVDLPPKSHVVTSKHPVAQVGNFDLVKSIKVDYTDLTVSKWISNKTGLTLIHLDYEGSFFKLRSWARADNLHSTDREGLFRCPD